jgi:hypothetical protein
MKKLYILIILLFPFLGSAQKIYVDAANTTGVENGTKQHPFNTVEEGLANCNNLDTVFIVAGEYFPDSLKVIRNITIEGAGKEKTLVHGTFVLYGTLDSIPVTISSLYCRNVRQGDSTYTYTPLTVKNCRLEMVNDSVPSVDSTGSVTYIDNQIIGNLNIQNSSCKAFRKIIGCTVGGDINLNILSMKKNVTVSNCQAGGSIRISTVSKKDTIYVENNIIGDSLKIYSISTHPNMVINNVIGTGVEIFAIASSGNTFEKNLVKKGVLSVTSTALGSTVIENNIFENGGIVVSAKSAHAEVTGNTIHSDGTVSGIEFITQSGGKATGNRIIMPTLPSAGKILPEESTTICAIKVNSVSFPGLFHNTIKGGTFGISLISFSTQMVNNSVSNAGTGVYLQTFSCRTDSNQIINNSGDGMVVDVHPEYADYSDTTSVQMNYNVISNNGGSGVRLLKNARLENNTLIGNGEFDLYIEIQAAVKTNIYARNNLWDHETFADIDMYDIYDGNDDNTLAIADVAGFIKHPGTPELLLPENSAKGQSPGQVDFTWKNDAQADAYNFQLAADSLFTGVIISKEGTSETVVSVSELQTGNFYYWRVQSLRLGFKSSWSETRSFSTTAAVGVAGIETTVSIALLCYPNPFTKQIKMTYSLFKNANVSLKIYTVSGVELTTLVDYSQPAGNHIIEFDGSRLKPGIYFCQLVVGDKTITKKLIKNNTL